MLGIETKMIIRQMFGKKTLILFANSRMSKEFKLEKDIEVVIGSKKTFDKYKEQIMHMLHKKVKLVFVK
jgi:hypothetical protein